MHLPSLSLLLILQIVVSAASLVVEIVAGRMLAPYVGMSLYTWTSVIAVVLAGFSAGHWLGGRIAELPPGRALYLTGLWIFGAALTTAGAVLALRLGAPILLPLTANPVVAIVGLTMVAFFLPSFCAGVPAPVLAQISVTAQPNQSGRALGAMFAAGALGAIGGTLAAGFLFIAWLGSVGTLAAVTVSYVAVALLSMVMASRAGHPVGFVMPALITVLTLALAGTALARPDPCTEESNYFCIRTEDVSADTSNPVRMMVLDHLVHGLSARNEPTVMFYPSAAMIDLISRTRMGRTDFDVMMIGGGTFSLPRAWAARTPPARVTVAEIDPMVTAVAARDFWFDPATARVLAEDGRTTLTREDKRYDVIVGDAFTDIAVPPHLVTREFFELVRSRLAPDGVYLMNVIDHADRMQALAALVHTLDQVFPSVEIWTEARRPEPGERMIFILAAGTTPTAANMLDGRSPDPVRFAKMPDRVKARVLSDRNPPVLTDNYAPIDRLIGQSY